MTYAQSLGPYVRLPFTKPLQGQNCSSTLGMKSWFLSYLILPPTTTIELWLRFDQAVTEATRFMGPHKSHMHQYTTQTCSPGPDYRSLTDRGEGYHHGAPNILLSTLTLPIHWYSTWRPLVSSPSLILRFSSTLKPTILTKYDHSPEISWVRPATWLLPWSCLLSIAF
jgi:hypothetical protein